MDREFQGIADKIAALWKLDEDDYEINEKYGDVEVEFMRLSETYYMSGHYSKEIDILKKRLKEFKNERDLYDEASELDMMFPNGQDY